MEQTDVELNVNNEKAKKRIEELKQELNELSLAWAKAGAAGDKALQESITNKSKKAQRELRQLESGTKACERVFQQLNKATPTDLNKALKHLQTELKTIERGTPAWDAHVKKIKMVKAELEKVNSEMKVSKTLFERMKDNINNWGASFMAGVGAISGLVMAGKKAVNTYAEMQQEEANVRKYTGMTAEEVEHLNEAFKKMDTRTGRDELNKLAQEAGRLGLQSEEDVLGFVKAADKINVALDDLGEGATLTLSKLTDIFGDKQRLGVEQSLLAVGSVINELSQNSTASAPYLAEFAQRLAGVGAQAQMSIPEIMGFGAVLDSQGQKLEMSATALSKVIMNLFKDPAKIASATGLAVEEFSETCKRSTNEGLLMLLDRLHELGGIDSLAPVFKDMGENGARASAVLAALAGNVDMVRQQQEAANDAFREATSIDKEFEVQNTTVQAGLEKARKKFNEMAIELGKKLMPVMRLFHSSLSYTMKALSVTIDFLVKYRKQIVVVAAAIAGYKLAVNAARLVDIAWTAAKKAATAAQLAFNAAVRANPLGLLVGGIAAAASAVIGFGKSESEAEEETKKLTDAEKKKLAVDEALKNLDKSIEESYAEQIGKVRSLTMIVNDNTQSLAMRRKAIKELEAIVPGYHASLTEEGRLIGNNTQALNDYYISLKNRVKAEKNAEALEENARKQVELETTKEEWEAKYKEYHDKFQKLGNDLNKLRKSLYDSGLEAGSKEFNDKINKFYRDTNYYALRNQYSELYTEASSKVGYFQKEIEKYQAVADKILKRTKEDEKTAQGSGVKSKRFERKEEVEEWKKKQEALQKAKLAKGEIDQQEYSRKMLELERNYQGNLMSVLAQGSSDYLAANAARLEAVRKLEEMDGTAAINRKRAESKIEYLQGEVSHKEYTRRQLELDVEEKEARLKTQKEGTQGYLDAQSAYLEAKKKLESEDSAQLVEFYKKQADEQKRYTDQRYADGELGEKAYRLALEEIELDYLSSCVLAYKEGSEERLKAEKAYADKSLEIQKKHQSDARKLQKSLRSSFFKKDGGVTDQESYKEELLQLEAVKLQLTSLAQSEAEKLKIEEAYHKARYELAKKYNDEIGMQTEDRMKYSMQKVLEYMETDGFKAFNQSFQTLVSGMGEIFSGLSDLIDAETTLQEQKITKKYEAEIEAAGNNSREVARLEEEKEKEIAKVKNEAEEKKYGMQIASTIAQTAISAVNAYSSAAAIPVVGWIMGPIAAAMAVAAGGIQLATLKKQHEAAMAQGYAAGGYTMPGSKYQPAGIVHAGEWVASQELLANPTAAATIAQLDQAQRTNTIGQLSKPSPVLQSQNSSFSDSKTPVLQSEGQNGVSVGESIDRLNKTLDGGIYAATLMTGDKGIVRQQKRYNQLMKNKGK